jgi:hypothetical protein
VRIDWWHSLEQNRVRKIGSEEEKGSAERGKEREKKGKEGKRREKKGKEGKRGQSMYIDILSNSGSLSGEALRTRGECRPSRYVD